MLFADGDLLGGTDFAAVIASVDGRDVAVAWVVLDDDAGLVGWVGTLPDYRRRGLGALVTPAVTNEAFERGARIVVAAGIPAGPPGLRAAGYPTIGLDRVWLPRADPPCDSDRASASAIGRGSQADHAGRLRS